MDRTQEAAFGQALLAAEPWANREAVAREATRAEAWKRCAELARSDRLLDRFSADLAAAGFAGETTAARIVYLAVTSRLLKQPTNVVVKGPSAGGKSYLVRCVLDFFPASAYYALTAMSERALVYDEEPLSHRMLVIYEAAGADAETASYLIRSLLSEGHVRYVTTEKTPTGLASRMIEREGPTGLVTTTTRTRLHGENETRLLSISVTDTEEQTKAVMLALASESARRVSFQQWHAFQEWLASGPADVTIPYAVVLATLTEPLAVRLRRDFAAVLELIRAHALLHQANRERTPDGRIVATIDDYSEVRKLLGDVLAAGIEASVPPRIRETVDELRVMNEPHGVTISKLSRALHLDKSTVSRRVRIALECGYLVNEAKERQPYRLVVGGDMPEDRELLPDPDAVRRCMLQPPVTPVDPLPPSDGGP